MALWIKFSTRYPEAASHKIENALGEYSIHFHFTYIFHQHTFGACLYFKQVIVI